PAAVFKVMPLEGVWTLPDELTFSEDPAIRGQLRWTLQIVLPAEIDLPVIERSRAETTRRKPQLCSLDRVERRSLPEDHAAQMLHRGPYRNEPVTLDLIHRFIRERGSRPKPGHREIYLNDPRRTEAAKLRTILRVASTRP
ncbi:MAG TPA: GyrI-like domain-containing protein, partial [Thermomicrobiales bacterium]|nr:GyrI-like domain-containing protein [Thermomicrobiales bacterium]